MSLINISNLTFSYDGSYGDIFTDVSFQIDTDWKLGFCGRNGRGKTTFLQLLMNQYEYTGSITASVEFEYFPFTVEDMSLNVLDILQSITLGAQMWQIQKELSKLAVDESILYRPFATLSGGERTKALLAALFLRQNSFLLIDEPTDHLDMAGRETVAAYLRAKTGYILISHDRAFLDGCVDHILSINRANIEVQSGNFSSWLCNKQMQDSFELAENSKLHKEINRLKSAARQSSDWANKAESSKLGKGAAEQRKKGRVTGNKEYIAEKSRRMQQRRSNLERRQQAAIDEKTGLLKNVDHASDLKIHPLSHHASRLLIADNLTISYSGRDVTHGLSFVLEHGERLALTGGNGSGKSSVIKLLCGERIPHTGNVSAASKLIISYVPQDASFLAGDISDYARKQQINEPLFKAILRKLDFSRLQFDKDMRDYSAGQKKKVLLAASLCQQAHVYIWDEPLNYIDVLSRMQIEDLITAYKPTMLFVEHDRAFCDNIATRVYNLHFAGGRL